MVKSKFLPMPLAVVWVFRLTFSPSPSSSSSSSSHLQLVVSLRYRKRCGWAWVLGCVCHLVLLLVELSGLMLARRRQHRYGDTAPLTSRDMECVTSPRSAGKNTTLPQRPVVSISVLVPASNLSFSL